MRVIFAAHEDGWGGFLGMIRSELPGYEFVATGRYGFDSLKGFDVLIPTMSRVSREMLETNDRLRLVQQAGAGLEGVDIAAARDLGIYVANVPADLAGNADSVAELGIYMLIGLSRDIRGMAKSLSRRQMGVPPGRALSGKTIGLVGLGGIGKALIRRLRSFDVRLIAIKRSNPMKAKEDLGLDWVGGPQDLPELLSRSDHVILALPMTSETKRLMNRETFSCMKKGAFLINLARGGLVDRDALEESLASGHLAGAGLDVFWEEPPDPNDPVFAYNVLATPHIGGSTDVSVQGIVKAVAENLRRLENDLEPLHLKKPSD
ncbi:MAG: 2-hydroxyacid dehydrogenase [Syntrophobacteraceae bacterium]